MVREDTWESRLQDWKRRKLSKKKCPFCKSDNWSPIESPPSYIISRYGKRYPVIEPKELVTVVCNRCGFVAHFHADTIGLSRGDNDEEEENIS